MNCNSVSFSIISFTLYCIYLLFVTALSFFSMDWPSCRNTLFNIVAMVLHLWLVFDSTINLSDIFIIILVLGVPFLILVFTPLNRMSETYLRQLFTSCLSVKVKYLNFYSKCIMITLHTKFLISEFRRIRNGKRVKSDGICQLQI